MIFFTARVWAVYRSTCATANTTPARSIAAAVVR